MNSITSRNPLHCPPVVGADAEQLAHHALLRSDARRTLALRTNMYRIFRRSADLPTGGLNKTHQPDARSSLSTMSLHGDGGQIALAAATRRMPCCSISR